MPEDDCGPGTAYIAYTDGATLRANPGPAGIGVAIWESSMIADDLATTHDPIHTICEHIGWATNNVAEYRAIIEAIEWWILESGCSWELEIRTDSKLIVDQLHRKARAYALREWRNYVRDLIGAVTEAGGTIRVVHVPRLENKRADKLSKEAASLEEVG